MKKNSLTDLSVIKKAGSLEDLAKHYDRIRRHAIALAKGDEFRGEEAVQNSMITIGRYFNNHEGVEINGGLVSISIRNHIKDSYKRDSKLRPVGSTGELIIEDVADEEYVESECMLKHLERLEDEERKTLVYYLYNTSVELTKNNPDGLSYYNIIQNKKAFINKIKEKYGKQ